MTVFVHVGYPKTATTHLSRLLKMADARLFVRLFPATGFVDAGTRKRLEDYYHGANRALAEELGLPLAQYG